MNSEKYINAKNLAVLIVVIIFTVLVLIFAVGGDKVKGITTIFADIATIIAAGAVFFVMLQAILVKKQLKADHERSRRENSVNLLLEWTKNLDQLSPLARKIIESLSEEQTRNLYNLRATKISSEMKISLMQIFPNESDSSGVEKFSDEGGFITLNEGDVSKLRSLGMNYLNVLEAILVAWQYSVIDRQIIEHQFAFLFAPEQGHYALEKLRTAAGGEKSYPAIAIFANHLVVERSKMLINKANVDQEFS